MADAERLLDHFHASSSEHWVVLKWRVHDDRVQVRVAVARSEDRFAERPEEVLDPESGQLLLYGGTDDYCQDQAVIGGVTYYYARALPGSRIARGRASTTSGSSPGSRTPGSTTRCSVVTTLAISRPGIA
jgi:hypothetical protein